MSEISWHIKNYSEYLSMFFTKFHMLAPMVHHL